MQILLDSVMFCCFCYYFFFSILILNRAKGELGEANPQSEIRNPPSLHIQILYRTPYSYQIPPAYMCVDLRGSCALVTQ